MDLKEKVRSILRELGPALYRVTEYVNHGGCAIVATQVGRELLRLGVECEVITRTSVVWGGCAPNKARTRLRKHWRAADAYDWDKAGISRNHLALRIRFADGDVMTWDTDGIVHAEHWFGCDGEYVCNYKFGQGLQVREAGRMARNPGGWNSVFDRGHIPELKRVVRQYFQQEV